MGSPLDIFSAPVRGWFTEAFGEPTPPQAEAWPCIQRGEHTLILAPTGSGKTLAAFLWGIDDLLCELGGGSAGDRATGDRGAGGGGSAGHSTNGDRGAAGCGSGDPDAGDRRVEGDSARRPSASGDRTAAAGVRILYISPLKALNNDIQRNLRVPLSGIRGHASAGGVDLPEIRVAVRSGDTPARERRSLLAKPPHILITTPESLYLLLTAPRGREIFRTVRAVIVDEIHTMAGTKRGVHLAVSLERLQAVAAGPVQRIGLSATIRPLEEVARFLGGNEWVESEPPTVAAEQPPAAVAAPPPVGQPVTAATPASGSPKERGRRLVPRPVTIVDAGYRKPLDLLVETVVEDPRTQPGGSVWPAIIARVTQLMREHTTTLIFANGRRLAERTADRLNEQLAAEAAWREARGAREQGVGTASGPGAPVRDAVPAPSLEGGLGFTAAGRGLGPTGAGELIRAHHGSMSREARLEMERDLKAGRLNALVGTSSLELGIDIGSVDLVVQLQSPRGVARGLQRVGRSGHLVGETSAGRILPTHREDVMEAAVVAAGMLTGDVELTRTPRLPLDVLAQQVVAMVSVEEWGVDELHDLVRCALPYEGLTSRILRNVIEMLSGRYPAEVHAGLRPRLAWDTVNDRLHALPGARLLATTNGGTIPDRGMFAAYLADGRTRIGELDEEFVFETRVGDTFMLGSQVWRVTSIDEDKVLVAEAPGAFARMPFWHGDQPWRPYELGRRVGGFRREVAERLRRLEARTGAGRAGALRGLFDDAARGAAVAAAAAEEVAWLRSEHALDELSAWQVLDYVGGQLDRSGTISSDRTIVVEVFDDAVGDPRMAVHSPFGGRVNGPWGIALASALREQTGVEVEVQADDDGILMRFPEADAAFPLDLVGRMGPEEAVRRILDGLPDSAVFGAQFRMNASRALLLPGLRGGRRTPFWLQRLRARDLLQAVRGFPEFPLLLETYRDCLEDVMDLPHLQEVLGGIQSGGIEVVCVESLVPSSLAQGMLWRFASVHLYEWDSPKAERQLQTMAADPQLLQDILRDVALDDLLRPGAVEEVEARLQRMAPGWRARTREELGLVLTELGDLSAAELAERSQVDPGAWIGELSTQGRIVTLPFRPPVGALSPGDADGRGPACGPQPAQAADTGRWVPTEYVDEYRAALSLVYAPARRVEEARRAILERFVAHAGIVTVDDVVARYPFPAGWVAAELDRMVEARTLAQGRFTPASAVASEQPGAVDRRRRADRADMPARSGGKAVADSEFVAVAALEQMHRRTLAGLRAEVRPVGLASYAAMLARRQHVHPETRRSGSGAVAETLRQLQASPVPGPVWERDVLPLRVIGYDPEELDTLTLGGELVWIASGAADPRRARVRFVFRGTGAEFLDAEGIDLSPVSAAAGSVYAFLREEGASFLADVQAALALTPQLAYAAIVDLVLAGLVSNDSMGALRRLLTGGSAALDVDGGASIAVAPHGRQSGAAGPAGARGVWASRSPLGDELVRRLAERRSARGVGPGRHAGLVPRPSRSRIRAAEERVRRRLEAQRSPDLPGRWAVVHRSGVLGPPLSIEERARRQARQLLDRYGVVTRSALLLEEGPWEWSLIAAQLQRMEMRGEVRRGYFVRGLPGVQFALPATIEELRSAGSDPDGDDALVVLNACDPAGVYGPREATVDGLVTGSEAPLAFARVPSTWLVQRRGLPILVAEDTAARLTTLKGTPHEELVAALGALCGHLAGFANRVTVRSWDGGSPALPPARAMLEGAGFYLDPPAMTWERPV